MESNSNSFRQGIIAGIPIVIGYIPAGMTFGLLAQQAMVGLLETGMFSIAVFAGASQYMAANLIAAGAGTGELILATFLLNFRHFLMSSSLARKLTGSSYIPRSLVAFGVTDETFAVASAHRSLTKEYLLGLELVSYSAWVAGTFLGFLIGGALPSSVQAALGVTLYCLFAALLAPVLRKAQRGVLIAVAAGLVNWAAMLIPGMSSGWAFIGTLIVVPALAASVPFFRSSGNDA